LKEEEAGPDEIEEGDEPYIEYVARWIGSKYLLQLGDSSGVHLEGEVPTAAR